jgi:DNA-binding CsgD family transcriptional regulator
VIIEDQYESRKNAAIADAQKYGLTSREAEVWLLHQAKHTYQQIAEKLYISRNTVKKHLKNIYAKQRDSL